MILFKPFMPYTKTILIPEENLDNISASIAECIEIAGEDIRIKILCNQLTQSVDRLAHIGTADGNICFTVRWENHALSTDTASARARVLKLLSNRILMPLSSNIVSPEELLTETSDFCPDVHTGTGTKFTADIFVCFSFFFQ